MDARSVPEIKEAIQLLEGYEKAALAYDSAKDFSLAISILEDYLSDNPDSSHRQFIQNLRFSYTRRLLQRVAAVNKADLGASLEHIVLVVHTVKDEAQKLMAEYPELKRDFDALMKVWAEPLARAFVEMDEKKVRTN